MAEEAPKIEDTKQGITIRLIVSNQCNLFIPIAEEEPKTEEPTTEETKSEEPKTEEPKSEEPKAEEPKTEEPKSEEPKTDDSKPEEAKTEEPKTEEPKGAEGGGKPVTHSFHRRDCCCNLQPQLNLRNPSPNLKNLL